MERSLVSAESLVVAYQPGVAVNRAVSFSLGEGSLGVLVGANGCGKTSVLRALIGEASYSGTVRIMGRRPSTGRGWEVVRSGVRIIPQVPVVPPYLTVSEYFLVWRRSLAHGCRPERTAVDGPVGEVLRPLLVDPGYRIGELSFGQRKVIEIILALRAKPSLVVADEPLVGVGAMLVPELRALVREYLAGGGGFLTVAHQSEPPIGDAAWKTEVKAA
jgi:ABC-type multidrug transport system ATPase subunit